ncbi:hypothetical protein TSAR_014569, partial [Trichomalopsis sarcophagae]
PGVIFSHKLSPKTDALLIKRRQKLGSAKTKTLSRGLPKGLEAVRALLYIYSHVSAQTPLDTRLSGLAVTDRPYSLSALKVIFKIRGVNSLLRINTPHLILFLVALGYVRNTLTSNLSSVAFL